MRILIQRVSQAAVHIDQKQKAAIGRGLVVLLGIEQQDEKADADWLIQKLIALRIFTDNAGKMNDSIQAIDGAFLVVSQFTLHASTKKGNRPSFIQAARPEHAIPLYRYFVDELESRSSLAVQTGEFGADMQVSLINDGPVTLFVDSKNRE